MKEPSGFLNHSFAVVSEIDVAKYILAYLTITSYHVFL